MQGTQDMNGGNGNGNGVFDDMTLKDAVKLLLEEIANVRKEILEELGGRMDKLGGRMGKLEGRMDKLDGRMDKLEVEFGSLRMEVHQNQVTFMKGHEALEKRVGMLEEVDQ